MESNYYLNKSAKIAYKSYITAYNSHSMKDVFNVHQLDLQVVLFFLFLLSFTIGNRFQVRTKIYLTTPINRCVGLFVKAVAASFCLSSPLNVGLKLDSSASKFRKKMRRIEGRFNQNNPYGRRREDDTRQFVRY